MGVNVSHGTPRGAMPLNWALYLPKETPMRTLMRRAKSRWAVEMNYRVSIALKVGAGRVGISTSRW